MDLSYELFGIASLRWAAQSGGTLDERVQACSGRVREQLVAEELHAGARLTAVHFVELELVAGSFHKTCALRCVVVDAQGRADVE
ncbi:hypothetical protein SNOD_10630 [Streptomyces nodosus]|uniref:Uncharacterized protein n=1 Tax=Streptomyces nodosus TaxID=40318 RepID=A0A0B5DAW9_9ACTN|nr:hypothetical protein SNOD_10630 [Streptomyces nodosus]